ncbi:hypothetical protein SFRURICE_019161 [Spodoptera frugiperda]|nr:hypothetical protein SFRURICE_019161 [Spodoptera frugiperda]
MRFKEIPSLTFFGSSGRGFCGTPAECMLRGLLGKSGDMGTVGAALTGPKVFDPCKGDMSSFAVQVEASRMGLDITGLGAMGTSVSSFSVGAFFSMGVREKPLKLPKKFTEGLMLPGGLLSESLRRRLELISSGLDRRLRDVAAFEYNKESLCDSKLVELFSINEQYFNLSEYDAHWKIRKRHKMCLTQKTIKRERDRDNMQK